MKSPSEKRKIAIAIVFATIMIFSGVGIMAFQALSQWEPGSSLPLPVHNTKAHVIVSATGATAGGTSDAYYGIQADFPTITGSTSATNKASTSKKYDCLLANCAKYYPAYPAYPTYPTATGQAWTLKLGSTEVANGTGNVIDCTHTQYQKRAYFEETRTPPDYTVFTSCSYSETLWNSSASPIYIPEIDGSTGGTDNTWTASIDSTTSTGTLDIFTPTVSPSSSSANIDNGQSLSLSETISNGAGGYSYSWSASGVAGSFSSTTASDPTWTASGSGTVTFTVTVTQSGGYSFSGTTGSVTVNSDPSISISSSPSTSDAGQTVDFSTTVSGGTGSYTSYSYVLYDGTSTSDSQLASGTSSSFLYTFSSSGQYLLDYSVTDSNGYKATNSLTQTVNSDPSVSTNTFPAEFPITITNDQSNATGTYQQILHLTSNQLDNGNNANYSNIRFQYSNGTIIPSWIENYSTSGVTVWLKLNSIGASSNSIIYVYVGSQSNFFFNGQTIGEYGTPYDNGANMFYQYASFYNGFNNKINGWYITKNPFQSQSSNFSPYYSSSYHGLIVMNGVVGQGNGSVIWIPTIPKSHIAIDYAASYGQNGILSDFSATSLYGINGTFTPAGLGSTDGGSNGFENGSYGALFEPIVTNDWIKSSALNKITNTGDITNTIPNYAVINVQDNNSHTIFAAISYNNLSSYYPASQLTNASFTNLRDNSSASVSFGSGGAAMFQVLHYLFIRNLPSTGIMPSALVGGITSSQDTTDVGNSVTFTASPSGGTGSYTYQWYENSNAISGATSSSYTTPDYSSSGTYDYYVEITDGAGYSVDSSTLGETVNSDPTVSASSNVSSADVNYPIEFSSSPSGGTSPYTYSWTIGGTQVSTSQDFSYSFSSAGSYTVEVTVTDSIGETYSSSVSVTINNNPSVSISSSQNPTDVGNSVTFTASESGGTGTISYAWTVNGASEGSGSTLDYSFSSSGSYTIEVTVTDSDGHVSTASITETVYVDPSVSISSSQNPTDIGNSVTFTASPSGGSGSYTYQWYLNSAAVSGATSSTYSTSFSSSGTDSIYVIIKDSIGNSAQSSTLTETVNSDPSVSISSSQNPTDVGNSVTFTASGTGGTGSYSYQWYLNGTAISGATSSTYVTSFPYAGSPTLYVIITDGVGDTAQSSTLTETVNVDPTVSISSSQNPTDIGNGVTFTASASGGTGSFAYAWKVNGATQSSTSNELDTSFSSAGKYYVNVTVTDSLGDSSSFSFIETVNPDPSVTISSSPSPSDVGVPVSFSSSASGGTEPYNYTWEINSVVVSYKPTFSYTFDSQGVYSVSLLLTDSNGNTARASLNVTVNPDPTATISTEYTTVDQGINDTFTANINGGTYPFNYTWFSGSQIVNYSSSFHMSFNSTGQHTLRVEVRDSLGETTNASVIVSVITKPSVSINGPDKTDVGTPTVFTGNATYGTEPYNFYWYVNGINVTSSSSGLYLSYSFASSGTYNVSIKAVDSEGSSASAYILVDAYPKPTVSISASKTVGDQGFTDSFYSSVSGGSDPISYEWYVGGNEVGSQQNLTYTFNSGGTIPVEVRITDFAGNSATGETNVTVNPLPSVTISAEYLSIDAGIRDVFTTSGQYGTSPYNYTWDINGVLTGYGSTLDHSFSSPGSYSVKVILRDADGNTASSIITVYVNSGPIPSIFANRTVVDEGMGITFLSGISGGTSPYNYTWEIDGSISGYGQSSSYIFDSQGTYTVILTVRDAFNLTGTAEENITVNPDISVSVTSHSSSIDAGQGDSFFSHVSGGTPGYSYLWEINGNVVSSSRNLTYSFTDVGDYSITLKVTDALGASSSFTLSITVNPDLSASLSVEYSTVDENITDNLSLTANNGTSPYTYSILINGKSVSESSTYSRYFTSPGTYDITAFVNDSSNQSVRITHTIVVRQNPTVDIVTPTNRTDANVPIQFRGVLSGGTGPYSYSWLIGGHTYSNSTLTHAFASSGNYLIQLTVSDAFGREAISEVNETIFKDPRASLNSPDMIRASVEEPLSLNISGGIAPYSIQWYFPGGEQFSGNNISYAFPESGPNTFEVQITDSSGYTDTQNFTVSVHLFVAVAANQTSGLGPLAVQFSSSVLGGSGYAYNWTFSPGHHSLEQNPSYDFPVGNYTVQFMVTSSNGATGYANISVQSLPPPVSFNYSTGLNITQAFHFKAIPNWDASGPYNMSWSFPNGQTLTGLNISYRFPVYHELNTVIATFTYGNGQTWTQYLTVRMIPAKPLITFTPPSIIPVDTMLSLNATASAPDSNSFTFSWDINGSSYPGQTQLYYFSHAGNYSVSVSVSDSLGASSSVSRTIEVLPQGTNSSIAISYTVKNAGPMNYYTVKVLSTHGITAVEGFLDTTELTVTESNFSYTSSGELAYFNITMDQRDYSSGTYGIQIVAFNNNSQSNHITVPFSVSSQFSSSTFSLGDLISFFGGFSNFLITILTLGGLLIAWASLRRSDNPDVTIVEGSGKGSKRIQLKGRKVK